ncbi:hypothetical protein [Actinomadura harenae]|uniref:DNA recombination-mediator protein A n=1 Tax=Actinomadura harenae TaxID=2483351 RepID=A0A3M2M5S8_9ACTN|nr:hypothetical protein [Actinomadura harenae]RMI45114.1 hypothetical protein EBO15_11145 [Actinomadura harenae]
MPQSVTITGTRSTAHRSPDEYRQLFEEYLRPFTGSGVRYYIGGASGIDSLSLLWLTWETQVSIIVAVPAREADQPADARQAIAISRDAGRLGEVVELCGETRTSGYHARNRYMVDRSDLVIGFPRAGSPGGGTHYTLDYAASQDKPHLVLPV